MPDMNPEAKKSRRLPSQPATPTDRAETANTLVANDASAIQRLVIRLWGQNKFAELDTLLNRIQQRDSELRHTNEQLEARVAESTRDLLNEILERQRAEAALKQQLTRISLLNQITQAVASRQDTDSILYVLLRQLEDHMGLDLGTVMLFDARQRTLNVTSLRIKNAQLAARLHLQPGSVLKLSESGFHPCETGQTVYCADTLKESAPFWENLACAGWRSAVAVPLMVEEELFGVLLAARLKPEDFNSGDCEFLRMLSEHMALAAQQSRLHHDLDRACKDLRRTQAVVLQQERLKALGQMAGGIAHDVNNALSPIIGFADLIQSKEGSLCEDSKRYLQYIRTAGEDIAHIVARLREFYRRHEDNEPWQELDLNSLIQQVVDMTRPRWRDIPQSNGITIEVHSDLAPELPKLAGMESEVREALTNLVLNAVDAMPKGGKITVRTSTLDLPDGRRQLWADVIDTGIGMSDETRQRCLEPFYSTKGKRGTGLGLAMVYGVMGRHGGSVEIMSEPGRGSTFRLVFPVREKLHITEEAREPARPMESLRILCIDDEPSLRNLIKELLERDGHEVEVSDGGQAGLDEFHFARERGEPFDVVITDLGMPYLDGRQVARVIKKESPETPVVMLTGWGVMTQEPSYTPAPVPVDGILSKPPRSRQLREVLQRFHRLQPETLGHS